MDLIEGVKEELPLKILNDEDNVNRLDYTKYDVCSIDPPGCKDIDDALSAFYVNDDRINNFWRRHLT